MNPDEARELLADYLGDELDPVQKRRFEACLETDTDLAIEVESLRETLAVMRSLDPPSTIPQTPAGRPGASHSALTAVLRYAAVFVFAFGAGFVANSLTIQDLDVLPSGRTVPDSRRTVGDWETRVAVAFAQQPGRSGLARALVALAQATREP